MTIGPGSRIAERYVLGHVVGAGGMGVVYRATTDRTDGELVIKVPHTTLLDDHEVRRRFRDEIVAGTRIDHPHVVHVLEGGCSTGIPYIVMELVAGTSLALWLISDSKFDEQLEDCQAMAAKGCEPGSVDTSGIEDTETAHQVTAVLAGVVGAAAVALFFIEDDGEEAPQVSIGPGGVVASGRF